MGLRQSIRAISFSFLDGFFEDLTLLVGQIGSHITNAINEEIGVEFARKSYHTVMSV